MLGCSLFVLCLSACEETEVSYSECLTSCYTGPKHTLNKGLCRVGNPTCDSNGKLLRCDGEVTPTVEICNGVDDDCNGEVDNHLTDKWVYTQCSVGDCFGGVNQCVNGVKVCLNTSCTYAEVCNGVDDDFNQLVDDIVPKLCYTGDPRVSINTPCRPGIERCQSGGIVCSGEILPSVEVENCIDDDCDGVIDDGIPSVITDTDITIVIDTSCSMGSFLRPVEEVLRDWIYPYIQESKLKFSLITFPKSGVSNSGIVISDFVSGLNIIPFLRDIPIDDSINELSYNVVYNLVYNLYNLSYRTAAPSYVIMFADEHGQSFNNLSELDLSLLVGMYPMYRFFIFTLPDSASTYDDIASISGGELFYLSDIASMTHDLSTLFQKPCL